MSKKKTLWFEGEKTRNIIFTEEDLRTVLSALETLSNRPYTEKQNEFSKVKTRIYFQMKKNGKKV